MAKKVTFDTVWQLGLEMPEVEKTTTYGASALKLRGQLLACVAINKSAEPNSLMLRIDFDQRDGLLAEDPATYYVTDHYVNYPAVLVRLNRIQQEALRDLLNVAWRFVMSKTKEKRQGRRRTVVVGKKRN
jgi:hypothetical protein